MTASKVTGTSITFDTSASLSCCACFLFPLPVSLGLGLDYILSSVTSTACVPGTLPYRPRDGVVSGNLSSNMATRRAGIGDGGEASGSRASVSSILFMIQAVRPGGWPELTQMSH